MYPYEFKLLDETYAEIVDSRECGPGYVYNDELVSAEMGDLLYEMGYAYMVVDTPVGDVVIDLQSGSSVILDTGEALVDGEWMII